ncbi:MAG TPA: lysophospholipid acyltransferase family protein, partial [Candidatus Margulisiibacteriota bacterium]|nr:lysophospholipid acyltransferase family protein [Candidatus Margulisiibacteriota bacterium]
MKKDYAIDYLSCIFFRLGSGIIGLLPPASALFLGRRLGDLFYYLDPKHRRLVYSNLKKALGDTQPSASLKNISKGFYRSFSQNLIEILLIPRLDKEYMKKYIKIDGYEHVQEGFKRGKGVIFLGVHEGSWELSNIICANLGFPFVLFVRNQKFPRLNALLNSYRQRQGCRIIQRGEGTRQLIEALRDNQSIGMTADQGGKGGVLLDFFGKSASIPSGAVRLALKYEAAIIPIFFVREKGPFIKIIVSPVFEVKKTGEPEKDVQENLARILSLFEGFIRKYPKEYLWSYKIWKYGRQRNILILSDSKTGHLRQSQALARIVSAELIRRGINSQVEEVTPAPGLLSSKSADIVISCGSSLAALNLKFAREN